MLWGSKCCSGEKRVRKKHEMKFVRLRRNALDYVEIRRNALDYDKMHKRVEIHCLIFILLWGVALEGESCSGEANVALGRQMLLWEVARESGNCSGVANVALGSYSGEWKLLGGVTLGSCSGEKSCSGECVSCSGEKS